MTPEETTERRFALAAVLLLPFFMLLVTDWTVTPLGMVDAWIYRALGRDLVQANASSLADFYYPARPFVLVPRYLLTRVLPEGVAHAAYGFLCCQLLLLAVLDFLTSVARPGTRLAGVLLFGTCMYLLRALGWGYIDGSIIAWFLVGLAGVARWYRPDATPRSRHVAALVAGACFAAMLVTHPMALPMLLTPLAVMWWQQAQAKRPGRLWLELLLGGVAAVLLMGLVCQLLYGRFWFFMPIVDQVRKLSVTDWKFPARTWIQDANWLVLIAFACVISFLMLAGGAARKARLTAFETFAYLNLLVLVTLMVAAQLFTGGYWLEYAWFSSYFVPSALFALAAMLGERTRGTTTTMMEGLAVALVLGAALGYRFEVSLSLPYFDQRFFPFRPPPAISLATLQVIVALGCVIGLVTLRWLVARPSAGSLFLAGALVGLVNGGPINRVPPGDAIEAEASASVAHAIGLIQDELKGRRPQYWYDDASPFAQLFQTISSAHFVGFSRLREPYPGGARILRANSHSTYDFVKSGEVLVILDDTAERFVQAQQSYAALGYALKASRTEELHLAGKSYWLAIATLEATAPRLRALELPTNLKAAGSSEGARISEREKGYLSFGPYVHLTPGRYRVTFHLKLLDKPDADVLGVVDAGSFAGGPSVLFQSAPLLASAAAGDGALEPTLEFTVKDEVFFVEFRVLTEGNSRLALRSIDVLFEPPST